MTLNQCMFPQVHNTPEGHVTRDYKEGLARLSDLHFKVVDTSGECLVKCCVQDSQPIHKAALGSDIVRQICSIECHQMICRP